MVLLRKWAHSIYFKVSQCEMITVSALITDVIVMRRMCTAGTSYQARLLDQKHSE